jgi:hypothetical protein
MSLVICGGFIPAAWASFCCVTPLPDNFRTIMSAKHKKRGHTNVPFSCRPLFLPPFTVIVRFRMWSRR